MRRIATLFVCAAAAAVRGSAQAQTPVKLKAGMVTGIDQVGLPIALERGFFEKQGLDVTIARPYATGVDALNALQAGESEIVQVGVPMIGAVLRGMDLVALGNYSGSATKLGSDATMAHHRRQGLGHRQRATSRASRARRSPPPSAPSTTSTFWRCWRRPASRPAT